MNRCPLGPNSYQIPVGININFPKHLVPVRTDPLVPGTQVPGTCTRYLGPGTWCWEVPGTRPSTRRQVPGTRYVVPGTRHPDVIPGTWYLVPGTRYQVPGTGYLVPGTRYLVPGTGNPVPGTRYLLPGTRYLVPGTWYLTPIQTFRHLKAQASIYTHIQNGSKTLKH